MPGYHIKDPSTLSDLEIEIIEKASLRTLFQAAVDIGFDAFDIFLTSPDEAQNVAEDIAREMMDKLGGYHINTRILGNVDYRKARYVILPDLQIRQALFVESKAEKEQTSARLQMSETSLTVNQIKAGSTIAVQGQIPSISRYQAVPYLSTTLVAHFHYEDQGSTHVLKALVLAALPNGKLQHIYNPDAQHTIWRAGPHSDARGETFRVRLAFSLLENITPWRVQRVTYDAGTKQIDYNWKG